MRIISAKEVVFSYWSLHMSVCLSVCLLCFHIGLCICLTVCLSVCCVFILVSVYVCLSVYVQHILINLLTDFDDIFWRVWALEFGGDLHPSALLTPVFSPMHFQWDSNSLIFARWQYHYVSSHCSMGVQQQACVPLGVPLDIQQQPGVPLCPTESSEMGHGLSLEIVVLFSHLRHFT